MVNRTLADKGNEQMRRNPSDMSKLRQAERCMWRLQKGLQMETVRRDNVLEQTHSSEGEERFVVRLRQGRDRI